MKASDTPLAMGVEEEYQIVDGKTGRLRPDCKQVMAALEPGEPGGAAIQHELHLTQIEMASPICPDLAAVRNCLSDVRGRLIAASRSVGAELVAAGSHPMTMNHDDDVTPKERYQTMTRQYQQIARDLLIFGCHVHVDMPDRELGVQVMNRVTRWLPALQALTANSPFWAGEDTGYASYRREMWAQWPMAGPPLHFKDLADLKDCVHQLIAAGAIADATRIYWDVRLPEKVPTIEFRVMDVMTRIDETVAIAGLIRALVMQASRDARAGKTEKPLRPEVVRVAMWQAARYGLTDALMDPLACKQMKAKDHIESLLDYARDSLETAGDYSLVRNTVTRMIDLGGGASRQRNFHRDLGWDQVVAKLAAETAVGTRHG
jgi:carboxylate-amine ligase